MPEPNPFVATDFSLRAADVPPPAAPSAPLSPRSATEAVMADASAVDLLIEDRDSTAGVLWHKLDRTFKRPLVQVNVLIHTPVVCESVESLVLASLWTKLVSESLNECVLLLYYYHYYCHYCYYYHYYYYYYYYYHYYHYRVWMRTR